MADTHSTPRHRGPQSSSSPEVQGPGCILRLFWIAIGNLILIVLASRIYLAQGFSALDLAYWSTVAAIVTARYLDIHRFHGATASGEPATQEHFRRYGYGLAGGSLAIWVLLHALHLL